MSKLSFASLFCGGGGACLGLQSAGLEHVWGLELDAAIAEVYRENIGTCYNENILESDPFKFEKIDWLHASPPCQAFSTANINRGERQLEIDCAKKVAEFIEVLQPQYFSLENVEAYRKSKSFHLIVDKLNRLGYWSDWQVLNAADFGVPQSRRRLVLTAIKGGFLPSLPPKGKWIGWYEAIKDRVWGLPECDLAPWQAKAFSPDLSSLLLSGTYKSHGNPIPDIRSPDQPSFTQTATIDKHPTRAILIESTGARSDRPIQTREANEPSWTIRAMGQDGHWHRANALLENVKVVQLDTACLARLQSFPDDYKFPDKKSLAGKIIGNSVPPLMAQKIARSILG